MKTIKTFLHPQGAAAIILQDAGDRFELRPRFIGGGLVDGCVAGFDKAGQDDIEVAAASAVCHVLTESLHAAVMSGLWPAYAANGT